MKQIESVWFLGTPTVKRELQYLDTYETMAPLHVATLSELPKYE